MLHLRGGKTIFSGGNLPPLPPPPPPPPPRKNPGDRNNVVSDLTSFDDQLPISAIFSISQPKNSLTAEPFIVRIYAALSYIIACRVPLREAFMYSVGSDLSLSFYVL